jgi:hypothetical protein
MSQPTEPTRRALLKAGLGLAAAGIGGAASAAAATAKIAPAMVQYQDHPKDGHQCSLCVQFVAPGSCKLVDGAISPNGWCAAFAPKA